MTRLPKLTEADNYINWRRWIKEYIQRNYTELLGLSDCPENETQREQARWSSAMVKARSRITLTLSDGPITQASSIVDDDRRSAKDLWEALDKSYIAANTQIFINVERDLEKLTFGNDYEWDKLVEIFRRLVKNLAL